MGRDDPSMPIEEWLRVAAQPALDEHMLRVALDAMAKQAISELRHLLELRAAMGATRMHEVLPRAHQRDHVLPVGLGQSDGDRAHARGARTLGGPVARESCARSVAPMAREERMPKDVSPTPLPAARVLRTVYAKACTQTESTPPNAHTQGTADDARRRDARDELLRGQRGRR